MKIKRIEDFAQRIAPAWSNIHLIPRGTPRFADETLRGTIRFGRRSGNFLPTIAAENQVTLVSDAARGASEIAVNRLLDGMNDPGVMISIGRVEKQLVSDVVLDEGRLILQDTLITDHSEGSDVLLYAVPIEVIGAASTGATTIQIRTSFQVANGDKLVIRSDVDLLRSAVEFNVEQVTFLGTSGLLLNWEVTLAEGIPRDLIVEDEIFFRATPAYVSGNVQTPAAAEQFGPFVLDYISGPLLAGQDISETFSIQLFDSLGDPLTGFEDPVTIEKNYPITQTPVNNEAMLFWDILKGNVQYNSQSKFIAVCDDEGYFALSTHIVPQLPPGAEWELPVRSSTNALLRVRFEPNDYRDFSIIANTNQKPVVGVGTGEEPGQRVEIVIRGNPGTTVEINNWLPVGGTVATIKYSITSNAEGDYRWRASSILFKPYFLALSDLLGRYGSTRLNSGSLIGP